jgi:hypothetical protein
MTTNNSEENILEGDETDDMIVEDQEEEQPITSSNTFEYLNDDDEDAPDLTSSLTNDDADDEISRQTTPDLLSGNSQASPPDAKQISIALALFRHRHQLSKSCINDLCDLLRCFGVQNVPSDFRSISRYVTQNQENILQSRKYSVCPECDWKGTTLSKCENVRCKLNTGFNSIPTTLFTFKLLPQITSILERHNIMPEPDNDESLMADIQDCPVRRYIVRQERMVDPNKQIITLLLNSDGVVVKKSGRSIWVTCMVINELPRRIRFNMKNVIICSISIGSIKPKKNQFQSFINDWVYELQQLELGFYISFPNSNNQFVKVHTFLIAATLDKPAQSLLMNLNEPVGFYSCVRCTIRGKAI